MKISLLQRQWHAIIIGLVWPIPYMWLIALTIGSIGGDGHRDYSWSSADQIGLALGIPLLVAYYVAMVSGPYDLLALVTMLIPAVAFCVMETGISWQTSHIVRSPNQDWKLASISNSFSFRWLHSRFSHSPELG